MKTPDAQRIAYVGDVHLELDDALLEPFCLMLETLAPRCDRIVLLGDLFNLWIGDDALQQSHQTRVALTLRAIRARGVAVDYVEGNRDYRIAAAYRGDLFDAVDDEGIEQRVAGRRLWAIHGDLANPDDRQYRLWRRWSRGGLLWSGFKLLPSGLRLRMAEGLEGRMRTTNLAFKREFPAAQVRAYAATFCTQGYEAVVLGHFHVEKELRLETGARAFVLPEWKGSRRHLEADRDGIRFVDS